jgi:hypothetical protein
MKIKYDNLRQDLGYTKEELLDHGIKQKSIKERLETELIKNDELQQQISDLK